LIRQDKERRLGNLEQELVVAAKGPKIALPVAEIRKKGLIGALRERTRPWCTRKAVTSALVRIVSNPAAGTRCSFQSIDLRDVRRTTIAEFPKHLLFYRLREAHVFILRVVHGARDL
jgi:hypothetical protein